MTAARAAVVAAALLLAPGTGDARAQPPPPDTTAAVFPGQDPSQTPTRETQLEQLWHAVSRLPLAAGLACVLAVRPRRRGAPPRKASVVQTQIILAIVGAVVMLVVGQSLARAFGIVGAAGLVRYRSKIDDPKDAGVMLSTLAVGLACGVGLWMLAIFGTVFILAVLSAIESFEKAKQAFLLTVKAKDPSALKPRLEELFARNRVDFELRTASNEGVCYEVKLPLEKKTDRMSNAILRLAPSDEIAVEWEEKKSKK
jgi:hypothetical protein